MNTQELVDMDYEGCTSMQEWQEENLLFGIVDEDMDYGLIPPEEQQRKMYAVEVYKDGDFDSGVLLSPTPELITECCHDLIDGMGMYPTQLVTNNMEEGEWYTIYSQDRDNVNEIDVMEV